MNVLAIDQGTSATKALVVGDGGRVLGQGSSPVTPRAGENGAVTQDPEQLLHSVIDAGEQALAQASVEVEAVGLGNQGETVLPWDRGDGRAIAPALSWQDRQAASLADELSADGVELRELTGLPLDPYFAAPKMALLAREHPDATITTIDAWTLQRLTGEFATDAATASRTMLLDLRTGSWSARACEIFGMDPAGLPEVRDCAGPVGETTAFGGRRLPVVALAVDQQAALFAQSCFEPGEAKCTYGTGAFLLANAGAEPPTWAGDLAACVAWRLRGELHYCLDGQVYTAGAALSWLERLGVIERPSDLDRLGAGRTDATFVPSLAGLGAPFWAPEARGGWLDLTLASTREDLVAAVVEGLAAQVAWLARAVADGLGGDGCVKGDLVGVDRAGSDGSPSLPSLRVDGGLTQSRALMQTQADLLQAPVEVYPSQDATALGIAALARLGIGAAATAAEAVGEWQPASTFEPRVSADEAECRLDRWRSAAEMMAQRSRRS